MTAYLYVFGGRVFSPDGPSDVKASDVTAHNRLLELAELQHFRTRETVGPWLGYLSDDNRVMTWLGTPIATVVYVGAPRKFGSATLTPFRALAIDGQAYYGRHNGPSMSLTMRPMVGDLHGNRGTLKRPSGWKTRP